MYFCSLLSSGKDSNYALLWAATHGFKPRCIITFNSSRADSYMLQTINTELSELQAKAMGLKYYSFQVSGTKEKEVTEIRNYLQYVLENEQFSYITTGALRSDYQRIRFYNIFNELGVKPISPLWWCDQEKYLRDLIKTKIEFIITRIAAYGLPVNVIGKIVDEDIIDIITAKSRIYGFNPAFEGGEAETLVIYSPLYKKRICIEGQIKSKDVFAELIIRRAWLDDIEARECIKIHGL
ncbi:MAG: diphthine--ammonia ligase [Desulfurococcales archaeon]|nr:diphthine--ammonia ligase [Desulfurococcales archaeon]